MIGVLTLFGETDLQPVLKKVFEPKMILFLETNCITSVQLMEQVETVGEAVDVVILFANALNIDALPDLVTELRGFVPRLRIILILNGSQDLYNSGTLNEYRRMNLDLLFDDEGFETEKLVELVSKGKLSKKKKLKGFTDDTEDTEDEVKKEPSAPVATPKKVEYIHGSYTIGVINSTRGAGATRNALELARFFAIQNFKTCLIDCSDNKVITFAKCKDVTIYDSAAEIEELKNTYNIIIIDFGTPYQISNDGTEYVISQGYNIPYIKLIPNCNIKVVLGFSDWWNIKRLAFFIKNDYWKDLMDDSFLFLVPENEDKVKRMCPGIHIKCRDDTGYRDDILNSIREEELK